jgi:hypothetical protein
MRGFGIFLFIGGVLSILMYFTFNLNYSEEITAIANAFLFGGIISGVSGVIVMSAKEEVGK